MLYQEVGNPQGKQENALLHHPGPVHRGHEIQAGRRDELGGHQTSLRFDQAAQAAQGHHVQLWEPQRPGSCTTRRILGVVRAAPKARGNKHQLPGKVRLCDGDDCRKKQELRRVRRISPRILRSGGRSHRGDDGREEAGRKRQVHWCGVFTAVRPDEVPGAHQSSDEQHHRWKRERVPSFTRRRNTHPRRVQREQHPDRSGKRRRYDIRPIRRSHDHKHQRKQ